MRQLNIQLLIFLRLLLTYIKSVIFLACLNFVIFWLIGAIIGIRGSFANTSYPAGFFLAVGSMLVVSVLIAYPFLSLVIFGRSSTFAFEGQPFRKRLFRPYILLCLFSASVAWLIQKFIFPFDPDIGYLLITLIVIPAYFVVTRAKIISKQLRSMLTRDETSSIRGNGTNFSFQISFQYISNEIGMKCKICGREISGHEYRIRDGLCYNCWCSREKSSQNDRVRKASRGGSAGAEHTSTW